MQYFRIGDKVQAVSEKDGVQCGTVLSMREPKEKPGAEQKVFCCVEWDNLFTNATLSISIDSRIIEGKNGDETIIYCN